MTDTSHLPRILILGCGFGGLEAAKVLAGAPVAITVIDRCNHHLFQPLLYQVATAGLSAPSVAAPIRHIFRRQTNLTVLMGEVIGIDVENRQVSLDDETKLDYDYLIVATGATHSYFGNDAWSAHAPGLKTMEDAFEIRRRILLAFEHAERETNIEARRAWLNFVVIGAGATGVELAGTLAEIARHTLADEFRHFESRDAKVMLLEGGPRVLSAFPESLSTKARLQLQKLGVEVHTGARVIGIDGDGVTLEERITPHASVDDSSPIRPASRLAARTVMWAAGVAASPLGRMLGNDVDRAGRVRVNADLSLPGHNNVFVIGDLASVTCDGKPVPSVSPAAKQMGRCAAKNILARLAGRAPQVFRYIDYGSLATIGRKAAVVHMGWLRLWGLPAWLLWLFAHIYFLIGFRNRIVVMIDWAWAYVSFQRYARIVIGAWRKAEQKRDD
ncbi:MAG: NAD(P)/FAD-dependent oxidoreductase [Burkholderiales bacterium]